MEEYTLVFGSFHGLVRLAGLALLVFAAALVVQKLRHDGVSPGLGALSWTAVLLGAGISGAIGGGFVWVPTTVVTRAELEPDALTLVYGWPAASERITTADVRDVLLVEACGLDGNTFVTRRSLELDVGGRVVGPIEGPRDELVRLAEALAERQALEPRWEDRTADLAHGACGSPPENPW